MLNISRANNAIRNIIFGTILKVYQIIMPFIMRTIMIYFLGIKYAGLNNLFVSILQVLNLAELGIGAAMIFSMYEPIAQNDTKKICALINLYKVSFRVIGLIVLTIGLIILPFIPRFVSGSVPGNLNIYILYLMHLISTVLSYWLFAYKNSLLYAHQRTDVSSKVMIIINTLQYIAQIISIVFLKNYYIYLILTVLGQVLINIMTSLVVSKMYPNYKADGKVDKETVSQIKRKVLGLITNKIGSTLLNSIDTIIISSVLGLTILATYQNYLYIITSIISVVYIFYQSCIAGIGNSLILEKEEKNYVDLKVVTFIVNWVSVFCSCCMLCLFQNFMKIWMGNNYLLDITVIISLVSYFYIFELEQIIGTYKDAAGIWYEDRFRPLITAIVNLILSIIMVRKFGVLGVKLATIISMVFISLPWLINNLFKCIFKNSSKKDYIITIFKNSLSAFVICCVTYFSTNMIKDNGILTFIIKLIICTFISNLILLLINYKTSEFKRVVNIIKSKLNKFKQAKD